MKYTQKNSWLAQIIIYPLTLTIFLTGCGENILDVTIPVAISTSSHSSTIASTLTISPTTPPTSFVIDDVFAKWTNVSIDSFNKDSKNKWPIGEIPSGTTIQTSDDEGKYEITVTTTDYAIQKAIFSDSIYASDYFALSVDANLPAQSGCGYGLVFGGDLSNNYYVFSLTFDKGFEGKITYTVTRVTPLLSQKRKVLLISDLPENVGIPSSLSVVSYNQNFIFLVNETPLVRLPVEEGKLSIRGKRVGIEVLVCPNMTANFTFDNFEVRTPKDDNEKALRIDLPVVQIELVPSITLDPEKEFSLDKASLLTKNTIQEELSTIKQSENNPLPGSNLHDFKVSARFYNPNNPPQDSWSYGFYFWSNEQTHCVAYVRSDSVWHMDCSNFPRNVGIIKNLDTIPEEFNDLELIVQGGRVLFVVNGNNVFYGDPRLSLKQGDVIAAIGIDDERTGEYNISLKNFNIWALQP